MGDAPEPREEVIPILRVADALAAAEWYARLGFTLANVHRFAPQMPVFATIARGPVTLFLSEHTGDARPGALVYLRVRDVHALADALGTAPHDNPWGWEIEVSDPDGNRLRIGTPSWW
ncbi:MAG: VOC family protein [Thermoleophilia bacterium]|nr:VOC family protein [Thermoleophilia bacterium]